MVLAAVLYFRGWRVLHRVAPNRFPAWRLRAFLAGLCALLAALVSPLDTFSGLLLSAHMGQHLLLISVVPPLILLGAPFLPLLRGLPRSFASEGVGPFLVWPPLRRFGWALTHPVVGWLALIVSLCAWHVPAAFELALRAPFWHRMEHACFLGGALLFWWSVIRPFPSRPHWPLWSVPLYLLAADIVNTILCAFLTFSDRVLYPTYETVPRLFATTALSDQVSAGVLMWVPGSLAFLVPAAVVTILYLSPGSSLVCPRSAGTLSFDQRPNIATNRAQFDLLLMPLIGRFLRAQSGRRVLQAGLLLIAIAVMADGFFGSQTGSSNLAGVLPWNYWRGLTVVALLVAGNFFCMACPFMLPRELGRWLGIKRRKWPRALRSKWLAVALLVLFFWAYEAFGLWDKPAWTAWLILSFFLVAFVVDAFFQGASFCKYVCPIGQFHFINSVVSPLEVKARAPDVCVSCRTHDCLRGNEQHRGCETHLHLPRKFGNLDCTLCLDCVRACPHDNIGLLAVVPGGDLLHDSQRSSIGKLSRRSDVAALTLVLVFAAFAGAAAMTMPPGAINAIFFLAALALIPALAIGVAAFLNRIACKGTIPARELACRFSLTLAPLGAAMWAGHFLFHLLSGYAAAWPVAQQTFSDWGIHFLGGPDWGLSALRVGANSILTLQTLLLDAGLLLALYLGWRIAREYVPRVRTALGLLAPWASISLALYAGGIWTFLQPMPMRGIMGTMP